MFRKDCGSFFSQIDQIEVSEEPMTVDETEMPCATNEEESKVQAKLSEIVSKVDNLHAKMSQ